MQHRVERAGEVVGHTAAGVALRQGNQTGEEEQQQQEEVEGKGSTKNPVEEGSRWGGLPPLSVGNTRCSLSLHFSFL